MTKKIPANDLIRLFRRMYDEHWPYVWGAAREGCVDCSGAYVYAYKQFGRSIAHGSNAIARSCVEGLLPIREAVPGMAAFKYYPPGHPKWNLPAKYRKGGAAYNGDLNDYYHIGLVDETGKYILNAQGEKAGFTRTKLSLWGAVGYLKAVDYQNKKGETPMQTMIVKADGGTTVKMRSHPSKGGTVLANILIGTPVEAGESDGEWTPITYEGRKGFMMSKFLAFPEATTQTDLQPVQTPVDNSSAYVRTLTTAEYNRLCEMRDRMEDDLKFLKTIVGVG